MQYYYAYRVSGQSALSAIFHGSVDASTNSKKRLKNYLLSLWMHLQTLKPESVDASTDSSFRVCGCIHRLLYQSLRMHPQTQKLFFESVDASTDSKTRVCGCINRL